MKTDNELIAEFGVYVTSNKSLTHISFGGLGFTPCGLAQTQKDQKRVAHPADEIRWSKSINDFKNWIEENRCESGQARLCKKCLASFDKWYNSILK